MGVSKFFRKLFSRRSRSRKPVRQPRPVTMVTTSTVSFTQTFALSMATTGLNENVTESDVTIVPTFGKSSLPDDQELSLTETMATVAGAVAFIVVVTVFCFIYRTKFRTHVRMRKTGPGERRSAALSLDLMELDEYDRQIRQSNGLTAFSSPMYGRGADGETQAIPIKQPSVKVKSQIDGDTEDRGYYSVVLQENTEPVNNKTESDDDDINANDFKTRSPNSKQTGDTKSSRKTEFTPLLRSRDQYKVVEMQDDVYEVFQEVESIDLSSPPTPHSVHSYVNVPDTDEHKKDYVNTDLRKESLSSINTANVSVSPDTDEHKHNYVNTDLRKESLSNIKTANSNVPDTDEHKKDYVNTDLRKESLSNIKTANANVSPDTDKHKKDYVNTDLSNIKTGQMSISSHSLDKEKDDTAEGVYYNSETSLSRTRDEPGHEYLPMSPSQDRGMVYTPMHSVSEDEPENQDNVYIYMETSGVVSSSEYANWVEVDSMYQNPNA